MSEKNKSSEPQGFHITDIWLFLRSKLMLHTLIRLFLVIVILWILQSFFLSFYTNHGQKLKLPNYTGVLLENANKHAGPRGYEIVISDSLFMKGRHGGIILSQVPKPGSMVKRGRMIYVTVSKYAAETLLSEQLPVLYGKKYEHKKVELFNTFELYTRITGVQFDPGPENHILQVSYKGRLIINDQERTAGVPIARGDTLEIVISTKKGGAVPVPDLVCKTLAEARFLLESSKLELGAIREEGEITDAASAYVIEQFPPAQSEETVDLGTAFKITIAQERPAHCDPQ